MQPPIPIKQFKSTLHSCAVCMSVAASFANKLSFWWFLDEKEKYKSLEQQHNEFIKFIKDITTEKKPFIAAELIKLTEQLMWFKNTLFAFMQEMLTTCKSTLLNNSANTEIHDRIDTLLIAQHNFYTTSIDDQKYNNVSLHYTQSFAQFLKVLKKAKTDLVKNFKIDILNTPNNQFIVDFGNNEFAYILRQLQQIHNYKTALAAGDFSDTLLSTTTAMPPTTYANFLLYYQMFAPERAITAIDNKLVIYGQFYQKIKVMHEELLHHYGNDFNEALRSCRIIIVYKNWLKQLAAFDKTTGKTLQHSFLTYDKSSILNILFTHLKSSKAIQKLFALRELNCESIKQKLQNLRTEIALAEKDFLQENNVSWLYHDLISAVLRHPEFTFGKYLLNIYADLIQEYKRLQLFNVTLPNEWRDMCGNIAGCIILLLSLTVSGWLGYSYLLISTITRMQLSHISTLFKCGKILDDRLQSYIAPLLTNIETITPQQLSALIIKLKDIMRLDEIGIMEKMQFLQWTTGLLNLVCLNKFQNIVPTACGYTIGTLYREYANFAIKETVDATEHPFLHKLLGAATNIYGYTEGYSRGYALGISSEAILFAKTETMPEDEARTILGVQQKDSAETISAACNSKLLLWHPDKRNDTSNSDEAEIMLQKTYAACDLLKKKFQ